MSGRCHRSAPVRALSVGRSFATPAVATTPAIFPVVSPSVARLPPTIIDATFFDVDGTLIMTTRTDVAPRRHLRGPSKHATADRPSGVALQLLCAATMRVIGMPVKKDEPRIARWVWHRALAGRTAAGSSTLGKPLCPNFLDTTRTPRGASAVRLRRRRYAAVGHPRRQSPSDDWRRCESMLKAAAPASDPSGRGTSC